jgi:beta-galactosidase
VNLESTPHQWPTVSSFFGIFDLCGFPKTATYIHRAHWVDDQPVHWTWPGREGEAFSVLVISNAAHVVLSLNGADMGGNPVDKYDFATWEGIPYQPGRLEAVAYDTYGNEGARTYVETAGKPVALELAPDRPRLPGNGVDAQPVTARAIDAVGRAVPTANLPIQFTIEASHKFEPFQSIQRNGGSILFQSITGKAEIWMDGRMLAIRASVETGPLAVAIPPLSGIRQLTLLIETETGKPAGINGAVQVTSALKTDVHNG